MVQTRLPSTMFAALLLFLVTVKVWATPGPTESSCPSQIYSPSAATTRSLPDPWTFYNGTSVRTLSDFACRQKEFSSILQQFELGDLPPPPQSLNASLSAAGDLTITITTNNRTITVTPAHILQPVTPANSTLTPNPALITLTGSLTRSHNPNTFVLPVPSHLPITYISFANDLCALQSGEASRNRGWFYELHPYSSSSSSGNQAGSLLAHSWCISRVIDALFFLAQTDADRHPSGGGGMNAIRGIDPSRLAITGCSRNGKSALVAGAFEPRIALTIPQESGGGGAACWRVMEDNKQNCRYNCDYNRWDTPWEIAEDNTWYSRNFTSRYSREVGKLPGDHHFLAGMIAPRGLLVIENNIDWLSPVGTTICMRAGRMIYDGLGVRKNMGFWNGGRSRRHCAFPPEVESDLNAFYERFLFDRRGQDIERDVDASVGVNVPVGSYVRDWSASPRFD